MPPQTTTPPFIPEEFDLQTILESGLGQAALPLVLGGVGAFGPTGERISRGVSAGLALANQYNQNRVKRQQQGTFQQALQGIQFPGSATAAPAGTPTAAPSGTGAGGGTAVTPAAPGATAMGGPALPPSTTPGINPSATAGPGSNFDLGALLAAGVPLGNLSDIVDLMTVFKPATAKPLDPATAALREQQTELARVRQDQSRASAEAARARAKRLTTLPPYGYSPYTPANQLSLMLARANAQLEDMLPDDPGYDEAIAQRDAIADQLSRQFPTQRQAGGVKALDRETAQKILEEAQGDKNRAREIARERGYTF